MPCCYVSEGGTYLSLSFFHFVAANVTLKVALFVAAGSFMGRAKLSGFVTLWAYALFCPSLKPDFSVDKNMASFCRDLTIEKFNNVSSILCLHDVHMYNYIVVASGPYFIWKSYYHFKMKKKYKKTTWMIESRWRRNIRKLPE